MQSHPFYNTTDNAGNTLKYCNANAVIVKSVSGKIYMGTNPQKKTLSTAKGFDDIVAQFGLRPTKFKTVLKAQKAFMREFRARKFFNKKEFARNGKQHTTDTTPPLEIRLPEIPSRKPKMVAATASISHESIRALMHLCTIGSSTEAEALAKDLGIK